MARAGATDNVVFYDSLNAAGTPQATTRQEDQFLVVRSTKKGGAIRLRSVTFPTLFVRRAAGITANVPSTFYYLGTDDSELESSFLVRRNFGGLPINLKESFNGIQS